MKYGKIEELDDREMKRIHESIENIVVINKDIWSIVEMNSFPK